MFNFFRALFYGDKGGKTTAVNASESPISPPPAVANNGYTTVLKSPEIVAEIVFKAKSAASDFCKSQLFPNHILAASMFHQLVLNIEEGDGSKTDGVYEITYWQMTFTGKIVRERYYCNHQPPHLHQIFRDFKLAYERAIAGL